MKRSNRSQGRDANQTTSLQNKACQSLLPRQHLDEKPCIFKLGFGIQSFRPFCQSGSVYFMLVRPQTNIEQSVSNSKCCPKCCPKCQKQKQALYRTVLPPECTKSGRSWNMCLFFLLLAVIFPVYLYQVLMLSCRANECRAAPRSTEYVQTTFSNMSTTSALRRAVYACITQDT
jgi:hypothetical protein